MSKRPCFSKYGCTNIALHRGSVPEQRHKMAKDEPLKWPFAAADITFFFVVLANFCTGMLFEHLASRSHCVSFILANFLRSVQ